MDEQPQEGSPSIESRLSALFEKTETPEAPKSEEPPPEQDTEQAEAPVAEDTPEQTEESDPFADVTAEDGNTYKVPAALKDGYLRQSDYTKKTQELATIRKAAEDRYQYAEAREQILGQVLQETLELREKQAKLQQYNGLDWAELYNSNPGSALNLRHHMEVLKEEIQVKERAVKEKADNYEAARQKHQSTQWKLAVDGVKSRVNVSTADDQAMLKTVESLGFKEDELRTRFADPRFLHAIYLASKYEALTQKKPTSVQQVPPIVKPGVGKGPNAEQARQYKAMRDDLKRTGSEDAAARLLARFK